MAEAVPEHGMRIGFLIFLCLASRTADAKQPGSAAEARYDFYQVSLQAVHCKVKVSVNGRPNEHLSMDATHSSVASAPLFREDLKAQNSITLRVEGADADTRVTLNVQAVSKQPLVRKAPFLRCRTATQMSDKT